MDRKDFLKKLLVNGSLAAVLPTLVMQSCGDDGENSDSGTDSSGDDETETPNETELKLDLSNPSYAELATEGGFVEISSNNIIVVNTGDNEYAALSNKCTHQGCDVSYNKGANNLPCPCHGAIFNIDGSVQKGPASTPLKIYETTIADGILVIKLK